MKIKMTIVMLISLLLISCSGNSGEYVKLSPDEAGKKLDEAGVVILDVRTQFEYDEVHIDGSTLLTLDTINEETIGVIPDKNAIILVYCRSGNRSKTASKQLIEMGYTNIYDIGGIIDLANNSYFESKIIVGK